MMQMIKVVLGSFLLIGLIAGVVIYKNIGHTPGELMDYSERRLQGHPRLETIVLPVFSGLRKLLDEPSLASLNSSPFYVPPLKQSGLLSHDVVTGGKGSEAATNGRLVKVGKFEEIKTIEQAAKIAADGDIVEIDSGDYRGDVAVWRQKKLTLRGVNGNARLFADGESAEGKAIWVIRGGDFDIENIDFIGARVYDNNGAGIRFEGGNLRVRNCLFFDNENGILTTAGNANVEIENSEFAYNGAGDGLSHNLYIGAIESLKLTGSYFHHANIGHLFKSRARKNTIAYNRFTDQSGGRASYELDFPNGGIVELRGNIVQQNRRTENSTMINYGEEGYSWEENKLFLVNNTLVNDQPYGGAFLRVAEGAELVVSTNNLLVGPGQYHIEDELIVNNDMQAEKTAFIDAENNDYQLNLLGKELALLPQEKTLPENHEPIMTNQYVYPRGVAKLTGETRYAGAMQPAE